MARNFVAASSQVLLTSATPVTARSLTLACWFKPIAANVAYPFFQIDDGTLNERFFLGGSVTGTVRVTAQHLAAGAIGATVATYSAGVLAHAGGVFTATTIIPYLNGVAPAPVASTTAPSGVSKVRIGSNTSTFMNGDLAECGLWNIALSAADMATLALGVSPLLVRRDALVGYWPLRHGYSPEVDLMSTRTAAVTGATVVAHPRVLLPSQRQYPRAGSTSPIPPVTTPPIEQPSVGGGRYRRPEPVRIPQQVIDDVEALYRLIYQNRKALDAETLRAVADLVGFFAESYDGRLPPPEAVHWRDLVEYPDIDLSILRTAADLIIAAPVQQRPDRGPAPTPAWAVSTSQAGAVDRALERLKRDAKAAAVRAAQAEEEEEEDALIALLLVL